jgi:hypothetical protein
MLEYRIYLLDQDGHIFRAEEFTSTSDELAVMKARELSEGCMVEIWQYARVVGRLPAEITKAPRTLAPRSALFG